MDWSNEAVFEFLHLYEREPIIWQRYHEEHKDRNLVYDAWKRIQSQFSLTCSVKELKRKKENLMATYRKLSLKIRQTSKLGPSRVYKPEWFAYDRMASFLDPVYNPRSAKAVQSTEVVTGVKVEVIDDDDNHTDASLFDFSVEPPPKRARATATAWPLPYRGTPPQLEHRLDTPPEFSEPAALMEDSHGSSNKQHDYGVPVQCQQGESQDDCDIYGRLLARKLRKLSDFERLSFMHTIDGLFIRHLQDNPE